MIKVIFNEILINAENEAREISINIDIDFAIIKEALGKENANKILFKRWFRNLRFHQTHLISCIILGLNAAVGGLTAIGNVADVTGLTIEEIESTMDIINIDNIIEIMFEPELNQ